MVTKIRFYIYPLIILLFSIFIIEILSTLFFYLSDDDNRLSDYELLRKKATDFEQKAFCDSMHRTDLGHIQTARYLCDSLSEVGVGKDRIFWFFGGSTTKGQTCDNSLNWIEYLSSICSQVSSESKNFGADGANSDVSLQRLEALLKKGDPIPDYVVWGHWINEVLVPYDTRALNFDLLKESYPNIPETSFSDYVIWHSVHFLERLNKTLVTRSYFYRFLRMALLDFMNKRNGSGLMQVSERQAKILGVQVLAHMSSDEPVDFIHNFTPQKVDYALRNYEINFSKLVELSHKRKFKVFALQLPYYEKFYDDQFPDYNRLYLKWIRTMRDKMQTLSDQNKTELIDLHSQLVQDGYILSAE